MGNVEQLTDEMQYVTKEYEDLRIRRDQLLKDAKAYEDAYIREFGSLIAGNYKIQLECIKIKKAINYCRRRLNRRLKIDSSNMMTEIEQEMKWYYDRYHDSEAEHDTQDTDASAEDTNALKWQIREIITSEPYVYGEFLVDQEKMEEHRRQLMEEHHDYETYLHILADYLKEILGLKKYNKFPTN